MQRRRIGEYLKKLPEEKALQLDKEDMLFCGIAYGFTPEEYVAYSFKDKTSEERREYISERDRMVFFYRVSDGIFLDDEVRSKTRMYEKFSEYYKRDAVVIRSEADKDIFYKFLDAHPIFVEKTAYDNCGNGVKRTDINRLGMSRGKYFSRLLRGEDEYLLEELVIQSEAMSRLNASSVNTVRCITYNTGSEIRLGQCFMKIGRKGAFIDNGAAGGLLAGIDNNTGRLNTEGYTEFAEVFSEHPDSGVKLKGYRIPDWGSMLDIAKEIAEKLPAAGCLGFDFAHTDSGWVLIEINGRTQFIAQQMLYGCGYKNKIKEISNIDF